MSNENYHEIRAFYDDTTIRVYQAYNEVIANEAVEKGTFGSNFKMSRMTWIKPSFLWMMYRCGWGTKKDQEHILAIDIKREAFDFIVQNSVVSMFKDATGVNKQEWEQQVKNSEVRVQWDPERDISGNPLDYRSIQLGLKGEMVKKYVNEWIVKITDITDYVKDLREKKENGNDIQNLLPIEKPYAI